MDPWIMVMMDDNQLDKKLGRQTTIHSLYCSTHRYASRSIEYSPSDSNTEPYSDMTRDHVNKQVMILLQTLAATESSFLSPPLPAPGFCSTCRLLPGASLNRWVPGQDVPGVLDSGPIRACLVVMGWCGLVAGWWGLGRV